MRNKIVKIILLIMLLGMLAIPFLQTQFNFVELTPLSGAIDKPEKKAFSLKDWFSGEYQQNQEAYINETFGFRGLFIRINNQIAYSVFNKAKANGVVIGKEDYLFEEDYIKAYYGQDFIGTDSIAQRIQKLKFIQDTLSKLNKDLILVFAAGKGSYYPEYFPDEYKVEKGRTNYQEHVKLAKSNKLNFIDFNKYFVEQKNISKYPLYPQHGIHWSHYGTCLVADSMVRYVENKRAIDLANIYWNEVEIDNPRGTDYDIADGMNIKFKLKSFQMAYPKLQFESTEGKDKVAVLVISDSFYKSLFDEEIITKSFTDNQFWYYNKQVFSTKEKTQNEVSKLKLKDEIMKHDVIFILATEATLPDLGWGFIENTYKLFKN